METRALIARVGLLVMGFVCVAVGWQGQRKQGASGADGSAGIILLDTDDRCHLLLDGKDQGVVNPDEEKRFSVTLGEHILKCTAEGARDLVWRKVIEVKNSEQVAALISLKALHIQYDAATAKLQKGAPKTPPSATTNSPTVNASIGSTLRVRCTPTMSGVPLYAVRSSFTRVLQSISCGERVTIIEEPMGLYTRVRSRSGVEGFVINTQLETPP